MNSMKLVGASHFISWKSPFLILTGSGFYQIWLIGAVNWKEKIPKQCCDTTMPESILTKDESNAVPHLLSSLVWIDQYNECNGMKSFMEFMLCEHNATPLLLPCLVQVLNINHCTQQQFPITSSIGPRQSTNFNKFYA